MNLELLRELNNLNWNIIIIDDEEDCWIEDEEE